MSTFFQMCVSQCPDKFATYTEMQLQHKLGKSYWDYYRQFCKPGFNNPDKVLIHMMNCALKIVMYSSALLELLHLTLWSTLA